MMTQYQRALLEYLALSKLEEDLRGQPGYELRTEVTSRKIAAREILEKLLLR